VYRVRKVFVATGKAFTVRLKDAVWLSEPEDPVTVTPTWPVAAVAAAVIVSESDDPGVTDAGVGPYVTPEGRPLN
jgi:hypothetical protein